jgi:hypothetical protein
MTDYYLCAVITKRKEKQYSLADAKHTMLAVLNPPNIGQTVPAALEMRNDVVA